MSSSDHIHLQSAIAAMESALALAKAGLRESLSKSAELREYVGESKSLSKMELVRELEELKKKPELDMHDTQRIGSLIARASEVEPEAAGRALRQSIRQLKDQDSAVIVKSAQLHNILNSMTDEAASDVKAVLKSRRQVFSNS